MHIVIRGVSQVVIDPDQLTISSLCRGGPLLGTRDLSPVVSSRSARNSRVGTMILQPYLAVIAPYSKQAYQWAVSPVGVLLHTNVVCRLSDVGVKVPASPHPHYAVVLC